MTHSPTVFTPSTLLLAVVMTGLNQSFVGPASAQVTADDTAGSIQKSEEAAPSSAAPASSSTDTASQAAPATTETGTSESGEMVPTAATAPSDSTATIAAPPPETATDAPTFAPPPVLPTSETAAPPPYTGQKRAGFALELFMGANKPLIAVDEELYDFNSITGGLFLGGKIRRVIVGLGVEMSRVVYRSHYEDDGYYAAYDNDYKASFTKLMFKPGVRFVIVQSKDQRVDMIGKVDLGAGTLFYKEDADYDDEEDDKYFLFDWDVALGARYWAHPQFAISATGGVEGNFYREEDTEYDSTHSYHTISITGAIQFLGVF